MREKPVLYHKMYGHGDPVIILHGLFGMSDNWITFARRMAEHFMPVLVDLRNHGRSPHTSDISYPLMAEDVARMMEEEWIHEAHIIGHSMGGKVAMQLADLHPNLIKKMVIIDIGPGAYPGGHEPIIEAMSALDVQHLKSRKEAQDALMEAIGNLEIVLFLMKNLKRNKKGGFQWKINLDLLGEKYDSIIGAIDLHEVDIPTLFIGGERSDYINKQQEYLIKVLFPDASIVSFPDAGHWVHVDQPELLYRTIYDFLK